MTVTILITICILLLMSYIFDISASKTRIPSIILLLLLGFGLKHLTNIFKIPVPDLEPSLPILGTIGLILIVLEGALEVDLNRSKIKHVGIATLLALLPMVLMAGIITYSLVYFEHATFKSALVNAIPLCIISSAIAIPSARNLRKSEKEFVTYESSLSDIFGVILFDFFVLNENIESQTFGYFFIELLVMLIVAVLASILLAFFIAKIKHHIKFLPIILLVVLIYAVSKEFHLPALIFILLFGLALHNIDQIKDIKFFSHFSTDIFKKEVHRFSEITTEFAFLIRSVFFLLFGFVIKFVDVINLATLPYALGISALIFLFRAIFLNLFRMSLSPLLYLAPRGLITILLFLSIPTKMSIPIINNALMIQVILICAIIMMIGLIFTGGKKEEV